MGTVIRARLRGTRAPLASVIRGPRPFTRAPSRVLSTRGRGQAPAQRGRPSGGAGSQQGHSSRWPSAASSCPCRCGRRARTCALASAAVTPPRRAAPCRWVPAAARS
eukprot:1005157-Prymnesium_polylepis.1